MATLGKISLVPKGEYNPEVTYERLDVVYYGTASYCAKKNTIGNEPAKNSEFWQLMVDSADSDPATPNKLGTVKPDDSTIGVTADGTISIKSDYTTNINDAISSKADAINYDTLTNKLQLKSGEDVISSTDINVDNAVTAESLATAGTVQVNLSFSTAETYTSGGDITPGVTGVLPVENGGTGKTDLSNVTVGKASALETAGTVAVNLASDTAETYTSGGDITTGVSGILGAANGGTGQSDLANVTVGNATNASQAITQALTDNSTNIATTEFVRSLIESYLSFGTTEMEAGVSELANSHIYFQYEE